MLVAVLCWIMLLSGATLPEGHTARPRCGRIAIDERAVRIEVPARCTEEVAVAWDDGRAVLRGDFDVRVRFELLEFPTTGARAAGLGVRRADDGACVAQIDRYNRLHPTKGVTSTSSYRAWTTTSLIQHMTVQPTLDLRGTFRITREGGLLRMMFRSLEWSVLAEAEGTTDDLVVVLYGVAHERSGRRHTVELFDLSIALGPPSAACVFPDGTCEALPAVECLELGGTACGPGSDCRGAR